MTGPGRTPADGEVEAQVARLAELGLLTSSLVHEIRQPVFAIKGLAELAIATGSADADRWRRVLDQTRHLEALVERFGGLGRCGEDPVAVDLNGPIRAAVEMLEHRARQVGADVRLALADDALLVLAEEAALRQVALNLLQNALDAVDGQDERRIEVHTARVADRVSLLVEDSGPGVPHDVLSRLFEPFVTSKPVGRGTGLGLYITRVLVHRAGGVVQLASKVGAGTVVRVELPSLR